MTESLIITQLINGLQFGVLLFLMAAGLTLVFGIVNFVNMAHGSFYMIGAYVGATLYNFSHSFILAFVLTIPAMLLLGVVIQRLVLASLFQRDHLDQVLATFGLILFFNEFARTLWGPAPYYIELPAALSGAVTLLGVTYPSYRILIVAVGLIVAAAIYLIVHRTRFGMLLRAGATDAPMVAALGVNITLINTLIFGLGAVLAGIAGLMAGPILSIEPGMGDGILILTVVIIVIGGVGSIRGAFYASLIVGVVDTVGRVSLPLLLESIFPNNVASTAGPAISSMLIYILMAAVLAFKPAGLFPVKHG
ncbi:MAG: branched-chain amino acid ABC transporter permease [Janthinobacterium lividum]